MILEDQWKECYNSPEKWKKPDVLLEIMVTLEIRRKKDGGGASHVLKYFSLRS